MATFHLIQKLAEIEKKVRYKKKGKRSEPSHTSFKNAV